MQLHWLDSINPQFPETTGALQEPSGLLAAGGNLQTTTLKKAYYQGIFPWYSEGEPPLWWAPNTRAVIAPGELYINRSLRKLINRSDFQITTNQCFGQVIQLCSELREDETWILPEMIQAYVHLHEAKLAHSIEVWQEGELVGGLYGVQIGALFCGESMFHLVSNASKFAFIHLYTTLFDSGFKLIDCQLMNPFLASLGVNEISREAFEIQLSSSRDIEMAWPTKWHVDSKNSSA